MHTKLEMQRKQINLLKTDTYSLSKIKEIEENVTMIFCEFCKGTK